MEGSQVFSTDSSRHRKRRRSRARRRWQRPIEGRRVSHPSAGEHMMHWNHDAAGRTHICTAGKGQAMVWRMFTGEWAALIIHDRVAIAHAQRATWRPSQCRGVRWLH